jgi:hypothetical protein
MPSTGSSVANMPSMLAAPLSLASSKRSLESESSTEGAAAGMLACGRAAARPPGGRGTAAVGTSSADRSGKIELCEVLETSFAGRSMPDVLVASGDDGAGPPNTPLGPDAAGARGLIDVLGARDMPSRCSGELIEPEDERDVLS